MSKKMLFYHQRSLFKPYPPKSFFALQMASFFYHRIPSVAHFSATGRLVKSRRRRRYLPAPLAKGFSQRAFPARLSLGEKLVWGVNRCAGLGNGQRPFPVEACSSGKGGKVREERRAFRRRIIRILLFEDENLFLSFVTATV